MSEGFKKLDEAQARARDEAAWGRFLISYEVFEPKTAEPVTVFAEVKKTNGTTDGSEVFFKELSREDGLSHRTNNIDQSPAYSARNQWIWDPNEWRKQPDGRLSKNTYRRQRLQDQKMLEEFK